MRWTTCFCDTEATMRRLVIRPGAIGDLIVSLPALECLRADYLEVWTATANVPLVRFAGAVRSILSTGLDLLGIADPPPPRLIDDLRRFDSIVSWYGANRPEFRELVDSLDLPFTFLPALPPHGAAMHATDFYLEQVSALAECCGDPIPRIPCSATRENFAVIARPTERGTRGASEKADSKKLPRARSSMGIGVRPLRGRLSGARTSWARRRVSHAS